MERNSRKLKKRLEAEGWEHVRTVGSHLTFKHPQKEALITLPHPRKDLTPGLVRSIYKDAGWR